MRLGTIGILFAAVLFFTHTEVVGEELLPDTYGNRVLYAEKYMQVFSMENMMHDVIRESSTNYPEIYRGRYVNLMKKYIDVDVLERAMLAALVKNFTVSELNALANFYGSDVGKSVMKKFGTYMADVMPAIQMQVIKAQSDVERELSE